MLNKIWNWIKSAAKSVVRWTLTIAIPGTIIVAMTAAVVAFPLVPLLLAIVALMKVLKQDSMANATFVVMCVGVLVCSPMLFALMVSAIGAGFGARYILNNYFGISDKELSNDLDILTKAFKVISIMLSLVAIAR